MDHNTKGIIAFLFFGYFSKFFKYHSWCLKALIDVFPKLKIAKLNGNKDQVAIANPNHSIASAK